MIKKYLNKIYKESKIGYFLLRPVRLTYEFLMYRLVSDKMFLKRKFKKTFGFELDLKKPKTLNAKMQWLKLYYRSDLHTKCADKYAVRDFIKTQVGEEYLTELLFHTTDAKDLIKDNLPIDKSFIIKTNHDSSGGVIVRDINRVDFDKQQMRFLRLLKENHYWGTKEYQYKNIKPRIIVEKLIEDKEGKVPNDYKIHCFNGKAKIVYVSVDREGENKRNIYDVNWNPLYFTWAPASKDIRNLRGEEISKPKNYEKMIEIAEKLAAHFIYVRIDLFNSDGNIYVGEITFHHGSGFDLIEPIEWDYKMGEMLNLPIKK